MRQQWCECFCVPRVACSAPAIVGPSTFGVIGDDPSDPAAWIIHIALRRGTMCPCAWSTVCPAARPVIYTDIEPSGLRPTKQALA
jgi:hypothetical protein